MQLDLFSDGSMRLSRARSAMAKFDLATARHELQEHLRFFPNDGTVSDELEVVLALCSGMAAVDGDELARLRAIADCVPDRLRGAWHRRLARVIECCATTGVPSELAGDHWLRAGECEKAQSSLQAHLSHRPGDGRARGLLADALSELGRIREAREAYLQAFVDEPLSVDVGRIVDDDVAALPAICCEHDGISGDPRTWVAAAGIVEGVFAPPQPCLPAFAERARPLGDEPAGARFYRLLLAERASRTLDERVPARREMKRLCPSLLADYIEQLASTERTS